MAQEPKSSQSAYEVVHERRLLTPAQIQWVNDAPSDAERFRRLCEIKRTYREGNA